jgi:cytochrome b involved in lipid metabolism
LLEEEEKKMSEQESTRTKVFSKTALFELTESNPTNTYIAIHENVYDVTEFLDEVNLFL